VKVLIPDSLPLSLSSADQGIEFIPYSVSSTDFSGVQDAELLVLWMNTDENLKAAVAQLSSLKLVQTLAAGPDHALSAGFAKSIDIASGRSLHDMPVTEHALALILESVRALDQLSSSQRNAHWDTDYIQAQAASQSSSLYTLIGAEVLIIGFGSIAAQLAPVLTALGAHVVGVARNAGTRSGFLVTSLDSLSDSVSKADLVISLLPYSADTEKFFNRKFFSAMKKSAIFINVGRGKTVDEGALLDALQSGAIRRAAIDVTYTEPLPKDSLLWSCPNLIITPHVSGGRPLGSEKLISANAHNVKNSLPIINRVVNTRRSER
jgi:phosphoglycerate dehydrogenase-like enzyme